MSEPTASPQPSENDSLRSQLFRYAQDLDELMQQHSRLQQQHGMILQSLGREVQGDDLLTAILAASAPLCLITDLQGRILRTGENGNKRQPLLGQGVPGLTLQQLLPVERHAALQAALARFAAQGVLASALQCSLPFQARLTPNGLTYDALAVPKQVGGRIEVHWFLQEGQSTDDSPMQFLMDLVHSATSENGVFLSNPFGTIAAVNQAFCQISGYEDWELVGNNPRILSSGRHENSFYQDFWLELLDKGSWSGTVFNRRKGGQIFLEWQTIKMVENEDGQVVGYLASAVDLSYTDPATRRLQTLAYTDPLTGLPNRRKLVDYLSQTLGSGHAQRHPLALLFIDLNRFKPINDELGHEVGDLVLKEVARRMGKVLLPVDLLARVGGDEFVVVLSGPRRADQAEQVANLLQHALVPSMPIGIHQLKLGASIGCARYPQDAEDMETLLKHADSAMYAAKRFALPFCFFDAGMDSKTLPNLEFDLWQALERGEITLLYQPQVRNDGQALRGCEALMRWKHPVVGDVEPSVFIALAERSGAIVPLGNWALEHACQQLRAWRNAGLLDLTLSLNVSVRQLRDPEFIRLVEASLAENHLPPASLELELNEGQAGMIIQNDTRPIQALRQLGVRIAIDDFGSSFNSLARLNTLSISSLKINAECVQELVHSADARAISNCMIAIGQALGIEVIAQGVENAEQAKVLQAQGCRVIQGFYSGRPVTAETLPALAQVSSTA